MSIIERAADRLHQGTMPAGSSIPPSLPPSANIVMAHMEKPSAEERQQQTDANALQQINLARLQQLGMVTPEAGKSRISEEFRYIKRPLLKIAHQSAVSTRNHNNLIMVTSSLPKEGKTFCAVNLAMSIAMELDHTVLLVDADIARPSVLKMLGLHADAGLMDILLGEKHNVADVMIKTNVEGLSIIPAGKTHKNSTELLASRAMSKFLDEIANRYPERIIIFDSPPLLMTSEARVLATQMGQIVLVVEAETTTQHAVKDALCKIEACSNVSLIYNKSRGSAELENYGYYQG